VSIHKGDMHPLAIVPELQNRENARWLALLIDAEGAIGWTTYTEKKDRLDEEYRYRYEYTSPYISIDMNELESKKTIDLAGELMGKTPITRKMDPYGTVREIHVEKGRALAVIELTKPYFDKFGRMAELLTVFFKHRTHIPADRFGQALTDLLGKPLMPKEVNDIMLRMAETQFLTFVENAKKKADYYLT